MVVQSNVTLPLTGSGDSIPWNFLAREDVQLIVAERDETDARQLLKSFDLDICVNYFDGTTVDQRIRCFCCRFVFWRESD